MNAIDFEKERQDYSDNGTKLVFSWPIDLPELWLSQDLKTKKYSFDVETIYAFNDTRAAINNTKRILEAFAQWMVENNHDVSYRLEYSNVFDDGISMKRQYDTIEEAYAAFRILVLGFISNAKDLADEEDRKNKQIGDISFKYDHFYREWVATCKSPIEFTIMDKDIIKLAEKVRKVIPEMEEIESVANVGVILGNETTANEKL